MIRGSAPKSWVVRWFRVAAIVFAVFLLHRSGPVREDAGVDRELARRVLPRAERAERFDPGLGASLWLDAAGDPLGYVLRTSPATDDVVGYAGPNDLLVGLDVNGVVRKVELLASGDTRDHVDQVREDAGFWREFEGWVPGAGKDLALDAVGGSTLTSLALAEGVEKRLTGRRRSLRFPEPLGLEEVREVFPAAASMTETDAGDFEIKADAGRLLGYALRTSPMADGVVGYGGPSEAWIGLGPKRDSVVGIRMRSSYDTPEYVERVRANEAFFEDLARVPLAAWPVIEFEALGIEGVSGATQTSYGVAEGVRRRLTGTSGTAAMQRTEERWPWKQAALAVIALGSLGLTFGRARSNRRVRRAWQVVLVVGLGLALGELVSLAQLVGWARHGVPLAQAPGLCLLVGIALVVPWGTRRQVYCHAICPHGALQEWVGRVRRFRVRVPRNLHRLLVQVPALLLLLAFVVALLVPRFDLAQVEAFDAWVLGTGAAVSFGLAGLGLAACLLTPMAYCRFACPTGALLGFVRSHGQGDRLRALDGVALVVLVAAGVVSLGTGSALERAVVSRIGGNAFGTTWSLKLREGVELAPALEAELHGELERIEASYSSWRPTSELSQFNASETTFGIELSPELFELVARAFELHEATGGVFDPTVGPLLDAWGVGPAGPREGQPSAAELSALLEYVGLDKLEVDGEYRTLRKLDARIRLDLGAFLQGYGADRLAGLLEEGGVDEYLIEVGGELLAAGAWSVAIEDPRGSSDPLRRFELRDEALATSGSYRMRHIVSPRTGERLDAPWVLCAVRARRARVADGWATALFASGVEASAIAEREGLEFLLVAEDGAVTSRGSF